MRLKQEPRELLRHVRGLEFVEMPYCEECCGFGGTFATKFPMISSAMGETKAANAEASGAEYVTSTDPSCLMHIDGILRLRKSPVRTIHLASILAQTAAPAEAELASSRRRSARGRWESGSMSTPAQEFLRNAAIKSADLAHRRTIRAGIDHYEAAVGRTGLAF